MRDSLEKVFRDILFLKRSIGAILCAGHYIFMLRVSLLEQAVHKIFSSSK